MREPLIEARQVEKYYGQSGRNRIQVIAPMDLCVYPGEILALLGPSGSGKSTLLRMLTGLAGTSGGQVLWHNKPLNGPCENVSIVFQSFALFPWLTVLENVEAPLKARGVEAMQRHKRSLKILDTVGLDGFESAFPKELSGGMKQRVGFARALVVEPEVLFMDEPFSALDVLTAENLRGELLELWEDKKINTQSVFIVTHNIEEAILLADRIIVLGKNPARIRTNFKVELPRPRDRRSPAFTILVDYVYKILTKPDTGSDVGLAPTPGTAPLLEPEKVKYQMLPHARPGGIAGFLEILSDHGGHADIYHLADDLQFEIDDMLPTVEAGVLLGFLKLTEGDAEITDEGRAFVEADILKRKDVFRDAALERVSLLRQITRSLDTKADRTLPAEFFQDMLEEHFSEDEAQAQIETAVNWGRYAELFDYDRKRERFFIPEELPAAAAESGVGHGL
ncbi:MAG: nitrate/sulfonate/bicarbonate ABC transporter ATP-binding protein [Bryobacteraceae bacterium]